MDCFQVVVAKFKEVQGTGERARQLSQLIAKLPISDAITRQHVEKKMKRTGRCTAIRNSERALIQRWFRSSRRSAHG